ncbi:MAG: gliding motility-associated C-terminal domain-containing protein [Bacteroidota bacterium]
MKVFYTLIFLCISLSNYATHIVGGGFDLQSLGNNKYQVTLVVYRDCENGQAGFNDPLTIGIFDKNTNVMIQSFLMNKLSESKINPTLAKCVVQVPGCTEKAIYSREIVLNPLVYNNNSGYYLSWERCCRNHIIQNIQSPGDASMTFYAEIPSPKLFINSTPKLITNPFTVLCLDNLFTYDIRFTDADKDSLVYQIITPVNGTLDRFDPNDGNGGPILNSGPYKKITWLDTYSSDSSIKGDPALRIDHANGKITIKPSETGVFVVAFQVSEFRNGVKIGFVNLELQFAVVNCITNQPPTIKAFDEKDNIVGSDMYVTIPNSIYLKIVAEDEDDLDTVVIQTDLDYERPEYMKHSFNQEQKTGSAVWNWKTYCDLHNKAPKKIVVTATDLGCPIPKTSQRTFYIHVLPMPVLPSTDILCLELHDNKETTIRFGDSARSKPYFKAYNIYRLASDTPYRIVKSLTERMENTWLDKNTPDYSKINYRYFIKVENECAYEGLSSDTLGTFDQLKFLPDKQYMYNVTVQNNEWVNIKWNQTRELDFARYFLYKGIRDQDLPAFKAIQTYINQKDTTFIDKEVNVQDTSYCYYVIMLDTCGNYGPLGEPFCTTVLKGVSKPFEHRLEWGKFITTDEQAVNYSLVRSPFNKPTQKEVGIYKTNTGIDDHLDTEDGRYEYEIDVLHEPHGWNGLVERSRSNREPLYQKPLVHTPNAFTPNTDFINDTWYVSDIFVRDFHLKVFNRWGQLVFETTDKNRKWDATDLKGNQVPDDVYIYVINYDGWDNLAHTLTGNVTVFR